MSATPKVLQSPELITAPGQDKALPKAVNVFQTINWNATDFAREQIRGLARRVFFAGAGTVRQVVFSAADSGTDVAHICDQVGLALAAETQAHIAVVGRERRFAQMARTRFPTVDATPIKSLSVQIKSNLWRVPELGQREPGEELGTGHYWLSRLAELRNEFEYSVIQGPVAGISSEAALLGQLADGIILVLGAHSTRRATARKLKETLEAMPCRILGTVLSGRTFPMPERIYRQL
jgi:hypothetical protein